MPTIERAHDDDVRRSAWRIREAAGLELAVLDRTCDAVAGIRKRIETTDIKEHVAVARHDDEAVQIGAQLRLDLRLGDPAELRLAGANLARRFGNGVIQTGLRETDHRDFSETERQQEKWEDDKREFDGRGAAARPAQAAQRASHRNERRKHGLLRNAILGAEALKNRQMKG